MSNNIGEDLKVHSIYLSLENLEIIQELMKKCICKIRIRDNEISTGFLCKITNQDKNNLLPVLITKFFILKDQNINDQKINISFNNGKLSLDINDFDSRKIYKSHKYNITIIEIKPEDKLENNYFLEIDNEADKSKYKNEDIYLINYPLKMNVQYSSGIIDKINPNNYQMTFLCKNDIDSSGCPIINSKNNKVIGVNAGCENNINYCSFLYLAIKELIFNKINLTLTYKLEHNISYCKIISDKFFLRYKYLFTLNIDEIDYELKNSYISEQFINNKNILELTLKILDDVDNLSFMFKDCDLLVSIKGLETINIQKVFSLESMFHGCTNLKNISDLSKWNTQSIISMKNLFCHCSSLENLVNISKWDTQNLKDMSGLFLNCSSLINLDDISNWNVSKITDISSLFSGCLSLTFLPDISKWDVSNVKYMNQTFSICGALIILPDISKWQTSNVIDMSYMFSGCTNLSSLPDISNWDVSNIKKMTSIFSDCLSLISLPNISKWNTSNIIDMSFMFSGCTNLSSLPDISKWNTCNVLNMNNMFYNCLSLKDMPDISNWNLSHIESINKMFYGCNSLTNIPDFFKEIVITLKYKIENNNDSINIFGENFIKNNKHKFKLIYQEKELDLTNQFKNNEKNNEILEIKLKTKNIIHDLRDMFSNCTKLISISNEISKLITYPVNDMRNLFYNCSSLISLPDISKWNTSNVTNMSYMFWNCKSLTHLPDISIWNMSKVKDISFMFWNCSSLLYLPDISKWDISNVTNISYLFWKCRSLSFIPNISKWNINNIKNMSKMFSGCSSLRFLNEISKWRITYSVDIRNIFDDCVNLIYDPITTNPINKGNCINLLNK